MIYLTEFWWNIKTNVLQIWVKKEFFIRSLILEMIAEIQILYLEKNKINCVTFGLVSIKMFG